MKCLQCGSDDIVEDVRVVDHFDTAAKKDLELEVYEVQGAVIFKGVR